MTYPRTLESHGPWAEHPVAQPIKAVDVFDGNYEAGLVIGSFEVGRNCTRIEATTKSGMHADIAYVRVWSGDTAIAEFCQHNIAGLYFAKAEGADDG